MTKELRYSILIVLSSIMILMLRTPLENELRNIMENSFISTLVAGSATRLILIIGLLYFMFKNGFLTFNGLYPSFTISNLFIFFISVAVILVLAYSSYEIYYATRADKLLLFGVSNLLIGVFEELLFRGIVFPLLLIHFLTKKRPILKAAFLSAVFFGLVHLIRLILNPESFFSTLNAIIYAIGIGFLFAIVLLRTRNILIPIILHALIDFTNAAYELKEEVIGKTTATPGTIIITLIVVSALSLIFTGIGMFLFKRVRQDEWIHKVSFIKL